MLGAHHILQHRVTVFPEAEYDKGLPEDPVLRVKGENLQRQIWPVSLLHLGAPEVVIHYRLITDPALQDRFVEHDR